MKSFLPLILLMIQPYYILAQSLDEVNVNVSKGTKSDLNLIAPMNDERYLAAAYIDDMGGYLKIWDLENSGISQVYRGHNQKIQSVAFSSGSLMATAGMEGGIYLWDLVSNERIKVLREPVIDAKPPVYIEILKNRMLSFSGDGKYLHEAFDGVLSTWNVNTGELVHTLKTPMDNDQNFILKGDFFSFRNEDNISILDLSGSQRWSVKGNSILDFSNRNLAVFIKGAPLVDSPTKIPVGERNGYFGQAGLAADVAGMDEMDMDLFMGYVMWYSLDDLYKRYPAIDPGKIRKLKNIMCKRSMILVYNIQSIGAAKIFELECESVKEFRFNKKGDRAMLVDGTGNFSVYRIPDGKILKKGVFTMPPKGLKSLFISSDLSYIVLAMEDYMELIRTANPSSPVRIYSLN